MNNRQSASLFIVFGQRRKFFGSITGIFGINETQRAIGSVDRFEMIKNLLDEHLTQIEPRFKMQIGRVGLQSRQHRVGHRLLTAGDQMDAANPGEIRFDEVQRIFPHRTRKIYHRIQPPEHRIVFAMTLLPRIPQPFFFVGVQRHNLANGKILNVKIGQTFEGVDDGERDDVKIGDLIGHHGDGAQHDVDHILFAVAHVDQFLIARFDGDAVSQLFDRLARETIKQLAHAAVEA